MSALVYIVQPDKIALSMDTRVVTHDDKIPLYYQTKFTVLPHLNLV